MISFKEAARKDVANTFLNLAEFADLHKINGKEMPVIVDENELIEREKRMKSNMDGIYARTILIYPYAKLVQYRHKRQTLLRERIFDFWRNLRIYNASNQPVSLQLFEVLA